jgi:hypothetical protein
MKKSAENFRGMSVNECDSGENLWHHPMGTEIIYPLANKDLVLHLWHNMECLEDVDKLESEDRIEIRSG